MLTERQKKILKFLYDTNRWANARELAEITGVTERTIRNDIKAINSTFKREVIQAKSRIGYRCCEAQLTIAPKSQMNLVLSQKQRQVYVLKLLLTASNHTLQVDDLLWRFHISEATLASDMQRIKKIVAYLSEAEFSIQMNQQEVVATFSAPDKYQLLFEVAKYQNSAWEITDFQVFFKRDITSIYQVIKYVLQKQKYELRYLTLTNFTVYIAVLLEAESMFNDRIGEVSAENKVIANEILHTIIGTSDLQIVRLIGQTLEANCAFKKIEASLRKTIQAYPNYHEYREQIQSVSQQCGLALETHPLFAKLVEHICIGVERSRHAIILYNPLRKKIYERMPLAYFFAKQIVIPIEQAAGIHFKYNELSFVASYIMIMLIELNQHAPVRVLLVVSECEANLQYLYHELMQSFKHYELEIDQVHKITHQEKVQEKQREYDLTIVTAKEDAAYIGGACLDVRREFTLSDKKKITERLNKVRFERNQRHLQELFKKLTVHWYTSSTNDDTHTKKFMHNRIEYRFFKSRTTSWLQVELKNQASKKEHLQIAIHLGAELQAVKAINEIIYSISRLSEQAAFVDELKACQHEQAAIGVLAKYLTNL